MWDSNEDRHSSLKKKKDKKKKVSQSPLLCNDNGENLEETLEISWVTFIWRVIEVEISKEERGCGCGRLMEMEVGEEKGFLKVILALERGVSGEWG